MTTPTPKLSPLQKLLAGIGNSMSDPSQAGTMGLAQGLLAASAPHMLTPVSMGQAMSQGVASSQQNQAQSLHNMLARIMLPMTAAKNNAIINALRNPSSYASREYLDNVLGGAAGVSNDPNIVGPATATKSANSVHSQAPGQTIYGPLGPKAANPYGPLPTGSQIDAAGKLQLMPNAAPTLQSIAANQAYGSTQGGLPAKVAEQQSAPHALHPGSVLGSMSGVPGMAPNVARMVGAGAQPAPQRVAPPPAQLPAPTGQPAAGPGVRQGMSLSQATGQKVNQTEATQALNADIAATKERQQRVANLEELNAVASGLKTGPGMDAHIAVLKALESVPGALGISAGKLQTITDAQIFNKTALNLSLQTVSSAGQHAYDAFKSVMNAFPELSKTPLANAVVTGSLLATARYEADKSRFAANWQQQNGMGYVQGKGSYDAAWAKNASFMSYFLGALPPAARAELFQKARTNATLRMEINQAAKSDAWLKSNGY